MGTDGLKGAMKNKKDEFYTRYDTVADEMAYARDVLRGKRILCNCDDPHRSEFVRYSLDNFNELGLESLESSCIDGGNGALHMRVTNVPACTPDIPRDHEWRGRMLRAFSLLGYPWYPGYATAVALNTPFFV